jgi:hypothetical protein
MSQMLFLSDFDHYASHLLVDLYPLDESSYRVQSLHRRASYSYVTEIAEGAQVLARRLVIQSGVEPEASPGGCLRQAASLGVMPIALVDALFGLKSLRNRVVHEGPKVNAELLVYPAIPLAMMCGFALYEVWRVLAAIEKNGDTSTLRDLTIDRHYLMRRLANATNADEQAALTKLRNDERLPVFEVARAAIARRLTATYRVVEPDRSRPRPLRRPSRS